MCTLVLLLHKIIFEDPLDCDDEDGYDSCEQESAHQSMQSLISKLQLSDMKSMLGKPGLLYLLSECAIIV